MKYFLYSRKSEEDRNRQVESIPRQIKQLTERFSECEIVDMFEEEMSAKNPGRPLFNVMIERIRAGDAEGILVWSINRLLRNPVDQGTIQWLLQTNVLKSIQTMEKQYLPKDNVLILNVDAGVSNQFIKDLIEHTVAALNEKVDKGWFPHRAPEGYLNNTEKPQGQRDISIDPIRFPVLIQAWEMALTGSYNVMQILAFLNRSGYQIKPHRKSSSNRMSRSALYRLFRNRFYAGYFRHNGEWRHGQHTPMVTEAEFDRVQSILNRGDRVKPEIHFHAYAGLIRCGRCGCQVGGENHRRGSENAGYRQYVYYSCSNGKRICNKKSITESRIEEELCNQLRLISIRPQYRPLLLEIWGRYFEETVQQKVAILKTQESAVTMKRQERGRLLDLRLQDLIDNSLFKEKKAILDDEIRRLEREIGEINDGVEQKVQDTENVLHFLTEPKDRFYDLSAEEKRMVAIHLGAKYFLTDGKLALELNPMLVSAGRSSKDFEADCNAFEQTVFRSESNKKAALDRLCSIWGCRWDEIRTEAKRHNLFFKEVAFPSDTAA